MKFILVTLVVCRWIGVGEIGLGKTVNICKTDGTAYNRTDTIDTLIDDSVKDDTLPGQTLGKEWLKAGTKICQIGDNTKVLGSCSSILKKLK